MFLENYGVTVTNSTRQSGIANRTALFLKKYGFNVPEKDSVGQTRDPYDKTTSFVTWDAQAKTGIDPDSETVKALSLFTFSEPETVPSPKYSKIPGPQIEIILGPDYELFFR